MKTTTNHDPIGELTAAITLGRQLAAQARANLEAATPAIIDAIRYHSGQSDKLERLVWSLWNDEYPVSLCSELAGLDARLAQATVAMFAARAHLGGDADDLLRKIITATGSQPPAAAD